MVKKMVYFGPPWNTWLRLMHTHSVGVHYY